MAPGASSPGAGDCARASRGAERRGHGGDRQTEQVAAGERHGGYGTLVRSWVAAPAGCSSQPSLSWPAPRRRARLPSLPTSGFAASPRPRVTVHFHQGLEAMARQTAALATEILERHEARYGVHVGRVNLVLADVEDDPNGFASPLPFPLVHVRAVAPDGSEDFGNYDDWLRLLLTHELLHIVHLDEARGVIRFGRKVLGRAPFLFPNASTPTWMVEGLATYEETQGTAFGRGRNPDARMVLRMAALEGDFVREDGAVAGLDRWPGGQGSYFFGEAFLSDLAARSGAAVLPDLARVHSGRVLPFLDEYTARKVTGATFHALWTQWRLNSRSAFEREAEAIRAQGLTPSRALTTRGIRQSGPRFSPDGHWIAYTDRNLTRYRSIHIVSRDGGTEHALVKRNGGSSVAWTPDGHALVYDEPEIFRLFRVRADLRLFDLATRPHAVDHARPARARPRREPGRPHRRLRAPARRPQRARARRPRRQRAARPHPLRAGHAVGRAALEPGRRRPGGVALAAGRMRSTSCASIPSPARRPRSPRTGPRTWSRRGRRTAPTSSSAPTATASRTSTRCALADGALFRVTNVLGGAFTPDVVPGRPRHRVRELRRARLRRALHGLRSGGAGAGRRSSWMPIPLPSRSRPPPARPTVPIGRRRCCCRGSGRRTSTGPPGRRRSARSPAARTPCSATPGRRKRITARAPIARAAASSINTTGSGPRFTVAAEDKSDLATAGLRRARGS